MNLVDELIFGSDGLLPVAITDHDTDRLLVLCFLNREALEKSIEEGIVHVFRRSKGIVVAKGTSSGHVQRLREIRVNCDKNSLEIVQQIIGSLQNWCAGCQENRVALECEE